MATSNASTEKTEIVYGEDNVTSITLRFAHNAKETINCCLDSTAATVAVGVPQFKDALIQARKRRVKLRYITEINAENIAYCKELATLTELRHLDKVKGNFAVNEKESVSSAIILKQAEPVAKAIYSNVIEVVEQQQYLFETLWNKATSADQRIAEIEGRALVERTEVIYGEDNALKLFTEVLDRTKKEAFACSSSVAPVFCMTVAPVKRRMEQALVRGVKPLQITEITKENLRYCKEFMNYVELRHMDNVKGNMVITDNNEYVATASVTPSSVPLAIYSNSKSIIEQQRLFFEILWSKAIPAEQKIREFDEGIEPEFLDVISDKNQAKQVYYDLSQSVERKALVILPNSTALIREHKLGILDNLAHSAKEKKADVRILCPLDKENKDIAKQLLEKGPNIKLLNTDFVPSATLLIVDDRKYFRAELKNRDAQDFTDAIGFALYSNSKPSVDGFTSLFDLLWKAYELAEQLKAAQLAQKEFIHIAAHELRTPIQPILGMAELLDSQINEKKTSGKVEIETDSIDLIVRNAKRLERLSSDILEIARIESGSLNLNYEKFDLNEVILHTIGDVQRHRNQIQKVMFDFRPNAMITVDADKERITEVIWNLLDNAQKFTEDGTIEITSILDDGNAVVTIKDAGKGIDADILPRLFSKFATKSDRGTGLGLFISKNIIEAHDGKIWSKNNENSRGATFAFMFPVVRRRNR